MALGLALLRSGAEQEVGCSRRFGDAAGRPVSQHPGDQLASAAALDLRPGRTPQRPRTQWRSRRSLHHQSCPRGGAVRPPGRGDLAVTSRRPTRSARGASAIQLSAARCSATTSVRSDSDERSGDAGERQGVVGVDGKAGRSSSSPHRRAAAPGPADSRRSTGSSLVRRTATRMSR